MRFFYKKSRLVLIAILSIIYNCLSAAFAFLLMQVTDSIVSSNLELFLKTVILTTMCLACQIVLYILQTRFTRNYVAYCMTKLKDDLIHGICNFSVQFFSTSPVESYQSFFLNDLKLLEKQYYQQIIEMLSSISLLIVAVVGICLIDTAFLAVVSFIIIISLSIPFLFKTKVSTTNHNYSISAKNYLSSLSEIFQGFYEIKSFDISKYFIHQIAWKSKNAEQTLAKLESQITLVNAFMAFIGQILILSSFALGGYFSVIGRITTGSIVALSQLLTYTIEPITTISSAVTNINAVKNVIDNCNQILDYSPDMISEVTLNAPKNIQLCAVSFSYDQTHYVIDHANYTFESPFKYAIIGKNGTGKSTLLKLIAGLLDGYSGEILIDGYNIKSVPEKEYNKYISYLSQSPFIFSMSLDDNLCMLQDNISVSSKELFSKKFNVTVNEGIITNDTISGGEKAKIAAIRTLIKESPIVLMDEPTAAMDELSKKVFDDIFSEIEAKLCIVVTHRLDDSLKKYDKYVIISEGLLYTFDSYESLMNYIKKEDI